MEIQKTVMLNPQLIVKITPRSLKMLCMLMAWPMGFNDLKSVAQKHPMVVTRDLNLLMKHGFVRRKILSTSPKQVEYSLTEKGKGTLPSLLDIVKKKNYL